MYLKRLNGDVIAEGEDLKTLVIENKKNLEDADLRYADLWGADLRDADLRYADLWGADLRDADLRDANLRGANLEDSNLRYANLLDAERGKWKLKTTPISITGLTYHVLIFDEHMEIGCEKHSFEDWRRFKKSRIELMDDEAWEFWSTHKKHLLGLCATKEER